MIGAEVTEYNAQHPLDRTYIPLQWEAHPTAARAEVTACDAQHPSNGTDVPSQWEAQPPTTRSEVTMRDAHHFSNRTDMLAQWEAHPPTTGAEVTVCNAHYPLNGTDVPSQSEAQPPTTGVGVTVRDAHPTTIGDEAARRKHEAELGNTTHAESSIEPPRLNSDKVVMGATKEKHRLENRRRQALLLEEQQLARPGLSHWQSHQGDLQTEPVTTKRAPHRGGMCPTSSTLEYLTTEVLLGYATGGCPTNTGSPWLMDQIQAAIDKVPHASTIDPDVMAQLHDEVCSKAKKGQYRVVNWDNIKKCPLKNLKVFPISMIPHKSQVYRAILGLSFLLKFMTGNTVPSVNDLTDKTAPRGAVDQFSHSLQRIIHAFAGATLGGGISMANWDLKDVCFDGWTVSRAKNGALRTYCHIPRGCHQR